MSSRAAATASGLNLSSSITVTVIAPRYRPRAIKGRPAVMRQRRMGFPLLRNAVVRFGERITRSADHGGSLNAEGNRSQHLDVARGQSAADRQPMRRLRRDHLPGAGTLPA